MMPISRRWVGRSVTRRSSIAISPRSGVKNPATRLSSVVLPQPEGPSSVISSPRRTLSDTSSSAVISPKRLVTPSKRTALSSLFGAEGGRSAGMLNVQHLSETEEDIGEDQQDRRRHDIHHRDRGHRGVGVFAHVVVERDRKRLRALRGDE